MSAATARAPGAVSSNAMLRSGSTRGAVAPGTLVEAGGASCSSAARLPAGVRRQAKYSSRTLRPAASCTAPTWGSPSKSMICGLAVENAGHVGTPLPFGSPCMAKLVQ